MRGARRTRSGRPTQRVFRFHERQARLERVFRGSILSLTLLAVAAVLVGTASGRYVTGRLAFHAREVIHRAIGLPPDRAAIDEQWRIERTRGIAKTDEIYRSVYSEVDSPLKKLLDFAGLDPDHALLRPGNFNLTLLLPSTVFLRDDTGRSYRMRPNTRSVWIKGISMPGHLSGFFLVPDTPEVPSLVAPTGGFVVPGSNQVTNSWGLRGPEPDLNAPIRGLILGDSNMQGLLIGDSETPVECLRRALEKRLKTRASLLNTGHLGYSPEQFYYSLLEYGDRFRPHFVVLSFCSNDFGNGDAVEQGHGDFLEGKYWFDRIDDYCRRRGILMVITPVPSEHQVYTFVRQGTFPGKVTDVCSWSMMHYCNPIGDLVDEFIRLRLEMKRKGGGPSHCPLYNGNLGDGHFSPAGAEVWGRALGRRISLLLQLREVGDKPATVRLNVE